MLPKTDGNLSKQEEGQHPGLFLSLAPHPNRLLLQTSEQFGEAGKERPQSTDMSKERAYHGDLSHARKQLHEIRSIFENKQKPNLKKDGIQYVRKKNIFELKSRSSFVYLAGTTEIIV